MWRRGRKNGGRETPCKFSALLFSAHLKSEDEEKREIWSLFSECHSHNLEDFSPSSFLYLSGISSGVGMNNNTEEMGHSSDRRSESQRREGRGCALKWVRSPFFAAVV